MKIELCDNKGQRYHLSKTRRPGQLGPHFPTKESAQRFLRHCKLITPFSWIHTWRQLMPEASRTGLTHLTVQTRLVEQLQHQHVFLNPIKPPITQTTRGATSDRDNHHPRNHDQPRKRPKTCDDDFPFDWVSSRPEPTPQPEPTPDEFDSKLAVSSDSPAKIADNASTGAAPIAATETRGCPISMVSGEEILSLTDACLPGPVTFHWQRHYRSGHARQIGLGCGWTHSASEYLVADDQHIFLHDAEGRLIRFQRPALRQRSYYLPEQLNLDCFSNDCFVLKQDGHYDRVFTRRGQSQQFQLSQWRHAGYCPARYDLDERGYAINFHYNAQHVLTRIQSNWGKSLHLNRDANGNICRIDLSNDSLQQRKTVAEYDYNDDGDLIAQRNANGVGEHYRYQHHLLIQRTLVTGFNYYYQWDRHDSQARCLRNWGDNGIYDYHFHWQPDQHTSQATDSRGYTTTFIYNDYGQIVQEIDNEGGIHNYAYQHGRRISYTDPEGHCTRYAYSEDNHATGYYDPLGHAQYKGYFQDRQTVFIDKDESQWRQYYDLRGLPIMRVDPNGQQTEYQHNAQGLLSQQQHPDGRYSRYQWNKHAELIQLIHPDGHRQHFHYDPWGQIIAIDNTPPKAQTANTTQLRYTPTGLLTEVQQPNGERTTYTYNDNEQLIRYSDPKGCLIQYEYDGLSQVCRRIDPEGHSLHYQYDTERNLIALINENGEHYHFHYDGNERLIQEIGFDGRIQHYRYNRAGHLIQHQEGDQIITEFERDALGQMVTKTSRSSQQPDQPEERSRYQYDPVGRLKETYNAHQYLVFDYDRLGKLTKEHHSDLNANKERLQQSMVDIHYRNTASGLRRDLQLPDGQHIRYHYTAQQQLEQVQYNDQTITQIQHDHLGRETQRQQGPLTTYSDYDPMGHLQRQWTDKLHHSSQSPIDRQYRYDGFGNLSHLQDGPQELKFIYNLVGQLTRTEGTDNAYFHFDPAGNLLAMSDHKQHKPQHHHTGNRISFCGDRHFEYDDRGNLCHERRGQEGKLDTHYHYNLNNQLIKVDKDGQTTHYQYDPIGRRISKRNTFGTTRYLWAGDQLVQEQRKDHKKTYIYEPDSFRPVAMVDHDQLYHYHLDHLGTPRELSNAQGDIVWKAQYQTYGNIAIKNIEDVENNLRFQGQYFDSETGLHYNRHRYYNPNTGSFTTQDPIGLAGGINNYQYAPNPIAWIDPLGLMCREEQAKVRVAYLPTMPIGHNAIGIEMPGAYYTRWFDLIMIERPTGLKNYLGGGQRTRARGGLELSEHYKISTRTVAPHHAQQMINQLESILEVDWASGGPYSLSSNNCTTFVCEALKAGGITPPWWAKTPLLLYKWF